MATASTATPVTSSSRARRRGPAGTCTAGALWFVSDPRWPAGSVSTVAGTVGGGCRAAADGPLARVRPSAIASSADAHSQVSAVNAVRVAKDAAARRIAVPESMPSLA